MLWFKFEAVIKRLREQRVGPEYLEDFEYLDNEMIRIRKEKGYKLLEAGYLHPSSTLKQ